MPSTRIYMKYKFNVILYISVCIVCLILTYNYYRKNYFQFKNDTAKKKCNPFNKPSEQFVDQNYAPLDLIIKELEYDAVRGKVIDEQNLPYLQSVAEVCNHYNLSTRLVKRHYLYSAKNASLYCWIRKVASTSFTKLFSNLRNRTVSKDYYKEIDILSPKTNKELDDFVNDQKVFKFFVVRHPFERIVSSYRDRLEDNKKYTAQAWIYAPKIFHLTRPDLFRTNAKAGSSLNKIFHNNKRLKLVPSFKEFVTWLLQEPKSNNDVHWDSYYSHCSVCDINYNFVMKLENYSFVEVDFILSKMGLNKGEAYVPRLEETNGGFTDYKKTCSYFKALTRDMVQKLYQRYKIDFEMFDYSYENYLDCASSKIS